MTTFTLKNKKQTSDVASGILPLFRRRKPDQVDNIILQRIVQHKDDETENKDIPSPLAEILHSNMASPAPFLKPIFATVFSPSMSSNIKVVLINESMAQAEQFLKQIAQSLHIDFFLLCETLALWMCSESLEVQLKPYHFPLEVCRSWPKILNRFSTKLSSRKISTQHEQPILTLKRNVMLSKQREIQLLPEMEEKLLQILFEDAKEKFLNGRYLVTAESCAELASIDFYINNLTCTNDENISTLQISDYMPKFYGKKLYKIRSHLRQCKKRNLEEKFSNSLRQLQKNNALSERELKKNYIDILMTIPTYGSAYFNVKLESHFGLMGTVKDVDVLLAVNTEYVSIMSCEKYTSLLTVPVRDCRWKLMNGDTSNLKDEINSPQSPDSQCLFLHFPTIWKGCSSNYSRILRLRSQQAPMIAALLNATKLKCLLLPIDTESKSNTAIDKVVRKVTRQMSLLILTSDLYRNKTQLLCSAVFDAQGKCCFADGFFKNAMLV